MRIAAPALYPKTLWQWFADSAEHHPTEPALEVRDRVVSYRELRELTETRQRGEA